MSEINKIFKVYTSSQPPYYYIVASLDLTGAISGGTYYFNKENNLAYLDRLDYDKFYILDKNAIVDEVSVYAYPEVKATNLNVYGPIFLIGGAEDSFSETVLPYAAPSGYGPILPPGFSGAPLTVAQLNEGSVNIFGHVAAKFPYGVTNFGIPDPRTDLKYLSVSVLPHPQESYSFDIDNTNNTLVNYIEPYYGDSLFTVNNTNNKLITFIDPVTNPANLLTIDSGNNKLSASIDSVQYLPISDTFNDGTVMSIFDVTNSLTYTVNVPIANYSYVDLATVVSNLFNTLPSPVSLIWDTEFNVFRFASSGPVISLSSLSVGARNILGFTGAEPNSTNIQATNSPIATMMLTIDASNEILTLTDSPVTTTYTIQVPRGVYTPAQYAYIVSTIFTNQGIPVVLDFSTIVPFLFSFTSGTFMIDITSMSSALQSTLGFDGTEVPGFTVTASNSPLTSANSAITITYNTTLIIQDITAVTNYIIDVPTGKYTPTFYASTATQFFNAVPCPVTLTWNSGLNRFVFSGGVNTISVGLADPSLLTLLGFTGLEPNGVSITATNAPVLFTETSTGITFTLTVPNATYTTTSLSNVLSGLFDTQGVDMVVSYTPSSFTFTKLIVPVAGSTANYQFVNTVPNPTTITTKIGTLVFAVSTSSQSTTTAPVFDLFPNTNIYVVLTVPNGVYTADSLAITMKNLYQANSPSVLMNVEYDASIQRFVFTKNALTGGDPGNFQFILSYLTNTSTLQGLLGTLPFAVSANPQQTSTAPPPTSVPVVGTGIYTTIVIPDGSYNEYELSQLMTNLYYLQGVQIVALYDIDLNRFKFVKTPAVAGDPALFSYVLTDGVNTTTANILIGLDVNPPPPIVASNPVIANYPPETPQMALLSVPPRRLRSLSELQVTNNNNTLITYTEPYNGLSDTITVDATNNTLVTYIEPYNNLLAIDGSVNQLSTYIDPYNNLLAIDGSVNQLSTYIDPIYSSNVIINNSNNTWITYIDPVNDGNITITSSSRIFYIDVWSGPIAGSFLFTIAFDFTIGTYTLANFATSLTNAIQALPNGNTIQCTWNVDVPNRFVIKSLVGNYIGLNIGFNDIFTPMGFTTSTFPRPTAQVAQNAPTQGILPASNIYVVTTIPNGTYTYSALATAMTNVYSGYSPSININVTYDTLNKRLEFSKSPLVVGDPGLFQFVSSYLTYTTTVNAFLTFTFGVSVNPQYMNLNPVNGTGITIDLPIPNSPTPFEYTETSLATAITTAYTGYSPSINITCTWNSGTQRFVFTKSPVVSGDPALFRFNACTIESRIGTLPKVTSSNTQTTSTAPTYTPYPGTGVTTVLTIPNSPTAYEYTQTSLATAITTAYSGASVNITCAWNSGTQRFVFTKSSVVSGDPALFRFNACTIESRIGTLPKVTSLNTQTTSTAPTYTPYPGTGVTTVVTIPNSPNAYEYTQTSLATAITTAYSGTSVNITCSWNAGTQRFVFSKAPIDVGDPALFRFNACTIESRIGTLPKVTSSSNQSTSTAPTYTPYPGTGINYSCTIAPNNVYSPVQLANEIVSAYATASPLPILMNVTWNSDLERFVFTKSSIVSGDPGLFRFVNTSTLNAAIGNLEYVTSANPQQTLSNAFFQPPIKIKTTNQVLSTYIDPYNNILPIDNTNRLLMTDIDAYNNLLPINGTNNSLVVYVDPLTVMTVDATNYRFRIQIQSPYFVNFNADVPFGLYTRETYASTVTAIFSANGYPVTLSWNSGLNRFVVSSPPPTLIASLFSANVKTLTGFLTDFLDYNNIADAPPTTTTHPNTNVTVSVPIPTSPTVYDYTATSLVTVIQTALTSLNISVSWDAGTQRFTFTKTPILTGDPGLFRFTGTSTINTRIGTLPTVTSANPQTTSSAPVFTAYPGTGLTVSFNVPNNSGYTGPTLATAITNQYLNYSPSINITCSYNYTTQRFDFSKLSVVTDDPALFKFNAGSTINARMGTLPTVSSSNNQSTTTAPVFTTNPATGITVTFNIPISPNVYQYIPTQLANAINIGYTNNSPPINITCTWNSVNNRFVFTKTGLDTNDPALFRFAGSTINSTIGGLPTVSSANSQTTFAEPVFGPFPGTGEYIILTVPLGLYTPTQLAQELQDLYNSYFPELPSDVFQMTVTWNTENQQFVFSKTPLGPDDPGNFQFIYSYNPITTITQLIGSLPFSISGNPLSALTVPSSPPNLLVPVGERILDQGKVNLVVKVYPKFS